MPIINVQGVGQVNLPDGMSQEEMAAAIDQGLSDGSLRPNKPRSNPKPALPDKISPLKQSLAEMAGTDRPGAGEERMAAIGRGFMDVYEGLKQRALMARKDFGFENTGMYDPNELQKYTNEANEERAFFESTPAGERWGARLVGNISPSLAVPPIPLGAATKAIPEAAPFLEKALLYGQNLAKQSALSGAAGASFGGLQFVPDASPESVQENVETGGIIGALATPALSALGGLANLGAKGIEKVAKFIGRHAGAEAPVAEQILRGVNPRQAIKTKEAAERLGFPITPAEATNSPIAAKTQGRLGVSDYGEERLAEFGLNRNQRGKEIVNTFLDDISPDNAAASLDIRRTARKIIGKEEQALSNVAKPIYESAYQQSAPMSRLKALVKEDGIIETSFSRVLNDPKYKKELSGFPRDSIKVWDLVKRDIDDRISVANRAGEKNTVRLYQNAKNSLLEVLDKASPEYKLARSIYGEGAKPLNTLKESNIGRLADLSDQQLKSVSKVIFDPSQTDLKVMGKMRDQFVKENPEAWRRVIRNEMERRLDSAKSERGAQSFYNTILSRDRDFKQFLTALKGMPESQQKLIDMRRTWKNLINTYSPKTSAGLAKSSLDVPRSTFEAIADFTKRLAGGRYDKAAVNLITSNQWDKQFNKVVKMPDSPKKLLELNDLFSRAAAVSATQPEENE